MSYVQAVVSVFSNYVKFRGRALRSEYWYFILFYMLGSFATTIIDVRLFEFAGAGPTGTVFALATLLPGLAVAIRRLHDTGRSGWFVLAPAGLAVFALLLTGLTRSAWTVPLLFLPLALSIYLFAKKGDATENAYGPPASA